MGGRSGCGAAGAGAVLPPADTASDVVTGATPTGQGLMIAGWVHKAAISDRICTQPMITIHHGG
jgi:hypothetical protein